MLEIALHHYNHDNELLQRLLEQQSRLIERVGEMSAELDRLTASVERNTTVDGSIMTLVSGMSQQIRDLVANATELEQTKAAMTALADSLDASSDAEAAAVVANTAAAPGA